MDFFIYWNWVGLMLVAFFAIARALGGNEGRQRTSQGFNRRAQSRETPQAERLVLNSRRQ